MKLILTLFLCCVTYVTASPSCSSDVLQKCHSFDPRGPSNRYIKTEEDLETYCQLVVKCSIDYWDTCGTSASGFDMTATSKQYKKIYKAVCGKHSSYRQKYLDNIECVNEEMNHLSKKCGRLDGTGEQDKNKLCKEIEKLTNCSYKVIENECGRDARQVYAAIYPDSKDYYGC